MNPINEVQDIWAYLRTTPLLWLMLTMVAYLLGFWCFEKAKRSPIVSPVAIAASFLGVILLITDTPYACLLYTSPSPRDVEESRMPSSA